MIDDKPWVAVEAVCHFFALKYSSAKNKIMMGTFPVPTYKVGKIHVVDKVVLEEYFRRRKEEGLRGLENNNLLRSQR